MTRTLLVCSCTLTVLALVSPETYACCEAPIASMSVSPDPVCVGDTVTFDATGSYDPDCSTCSSCGGVSMINGIRKFEWDWTNNGTYDHTESPGDGIATHSYSTAGTYICKLRVYDDDNDCCCSGEDCYDKSDTTTVFVTVVRVSEVVAEVGPYVPLNQPVDLEAIRSPVGQFPGGAPVWIITSQPLGASASLSPTSGSPTTMLNGLTVPGQYVTNAKCSGDDPGDDTTITAVGVDRLQYNDPDTGYTDISGTLYVCVGDTVTFKAIPDPTGASWPSGKPVWAGTAGASGTGSTKAVTFNTLSTSTSDYKTVSAECGNTVAVNIIVYDWLNVTCPQENFTGGSATSYGVYEKVDLSCDITPIGLTGTQVGGLRWQIVTGGIGTLSHITNNGTALYRAHTSAGNVTLRLKVQSGPSKGNYIDSFRTIVEPDGGACVKWPGSNIWHKRNTFSIGLKTNMYLHPKHVSFKWTKFSEGACNSQVTGWFTIQFTNFWHGAWAGPISVGAGNATTGCRILQPSGDKATLGHDYPYLPYYYGTFLWNIPWRYKAGTYTKTFVYMNQEFKVHSDGKAEVQKDSSGWFYNYHGWPSQPY